MSERLRRFAGAPTRPERSCPHRRRSGEALLAAPLSACHRLCRDPSRFHPQTRVARAAGWHAGADSKTLTPIHRSAGAHAMRACGGHVKIRRRILHAFQDLPGGAGARIRFAAAPFGAPHTSEPVVPAPPRCGSARAQWSFKPRSGDLPSWTTCSSARHLSRAAMPQEASGERHSES